MRAARAHLYDGDAGGMAAAGGIYAAPTNGPLCCCKRKVAGGACPAPTARCFLCFAIAANFPLISHLR